MTRTIKQPGPPAPQRVVAVPAATIPIDTVLAAGQSLLDAVAALLAPGIDSACLTLEGGAFGPFAYVIPALSPDGSQAAFYSETFRPPGHSMLDTAAITVGWRGGKPFFHCHALWTEAGGTRGCGHVLPDETAIAAPIRARGIGLAGARFVVEPDPETGFNLFVPRATATPHPPGAPAALALRLAPNQDLAETLDEAARTAGFAHATVQGGVASINQARFHDAPPLEGFATELLVRQGTIRPGTPAELDISIVDYLGTIRTGRLVPGDNPVLMTFEGALVATPHPTP